MSLNLQSLPPSYHTMLHFIDPLRPLTCNVIYRCPQRNVQMKTIKGMWKLKPEKKCRKKKKNIEKHKERLT